MPTTSVDVSHVLVATSASREACATRAGGGKSPRIWVQSSEGPKVGQVDSHTTYEQNPDVPT